MRWDEMKKGIVLFCTVLAFTAMCFSSALSDGEIPINSTNFWDDNFKMYVSDNFDTDGDGYLSAEEISKVKSISIDEESAPVSRLDGLRFFTELENLFVSFQQNLGFIDISQNTKLKRVQLINNKISKLDIRNCPALCNVVKNNERSRETYSQQDYFQYAAANGDNLCYDVATTLITDDFVSGGLGDKIAWLLDSNGKLTISGTGAMTGIGAYSSYGWEDLSFRDQIKTVVIENGITSIGDSAFSHEENLTSVTIPDSVTTIGHNAFDCCYSLPSARLPDTVTSIGYCAFRYCTKLTSINLPRNLVSIGEHVFQACPNVAIDIPTGVQMKQNIRVYDRKLCTLTLPATLTEIGTGAFLCTNIPVEMDIKPDFVIPESLHTIESETFSGISATYVYIPENKNGKTTIGEKAFANCKQLQFIWISDCAEIEIADNAFEGCNPDLIILDDAESVLDDIHFYAVDHGIEWLMNEYYMGDG